MSERFSDKKCLPLQRYDAAKEGILLCLFSQYGSHWQQTLWGIMVTYGFYERLIGIIIGFREHIMMIRHAIPHADFGKKITGFRR